MRRQNTKPKTGRPASRKSGQTPCLPQPHRRTVLGLAPRSDHLRPSRHFRQLMVPRRISGVCYPHRRATFGLTARSHHLRPSRHFPQPMKPGRISGVCYPHPRTVFRLTARSDHFRQRRHFPLTAEVRTHFGRTAPTGRPSTGHRSLLPLLPLLPLPADLTYPSSIRRTCPVMTNDRVSPLSPLP